jgi:Undecaprenyl-phosphate galactose phosphotransferase WbaP
VLVLGAGLTGRAVVKSLTTFPQYGLKPVAMLDDDPAKEGEFLGVPIIAGLDQASEIARRLRIDHAILAMPGAPVERLRTLESKNQDAFPHLIVIPNLCGFASLWVTARDLGGILGLEVRRSLLLRGPRTLKRCLDLALTVVGGIIVLPLIGLIAVFIAAESRGTVFYGQERIGRGGRPFKAWKFRSMSRDADQLLAAYLERHPELREEWERDHKLRDDPRVTRVGRLLRRTSLDELPQLWNVVRGEMSLIGPRPIVRAETERYADMIEMYLRVRPGISGLWQVSGRSDTTYAERVALDSYYVRNWSVWLDLFILAKTVRVVLLGKGAY